MPLFTQQRQLACRYLTDSGSWYAAIEPTAAVGMPLLNQQRQLACRY
jgi:hypothetical protein